VCVTLAGVFCGINKVAWSTFQGLSWTSSPQAFAGKVYPGGVVNETIENRVGVGWIADDVMPFVHECRVAKIAKTTKSYEFALDCHDSISYLTQSVEITIQGRDEILYSPTSNSVLATKLTRCSL
jgi:hypothetical protein